MSDQSTNMSYGKVAANSLAISALCVILFIVTYLIIGSALNTIYETLRPDIASGSNFILIIMQLMLVLFIFCFTAGLLSARVNSGFISNDKTALTIGGVTGLFVSAIVELGYFSIAGIWYFFISINHSFNVFDESFLRPLAMVLAVCLGLAVATTLMGAAGSYYYWRHDHKASGRRLSGMIPGLPSVAMLLLLAIILPVIAVYLQPGILGPVYPHLASDVKVSACRTGNDTILIAYGGGSTIFKDGLPQPSMLDGKRPFTIWINGKNASSADAIVQSGLDASISPASGLGPGNGSVTITGKDIRAANGHGTHIVITSNFRDGTSVLAYDQTID